MDTPPCAFTVRRNPTRRARPQTPLAAPAGHTVIPFNVEDVPKQDEMPPLDAKAGVCENLRVFLRIRPLAVKARSSGLKCGGGGAKTRGRRLPLKDANGAKTKKNEMVCLVVNRNDSVTLTPPAEFAFDAKRSKCEVYDGFSCVFPPDSLQTEVYQKVMSPLVRDFMKGKSGLLVAMGPTGSGKTHTMLGTPRDPGLVPLALQQIFCNDSRQYYLSLFEIRSERGKSEKIFDLSSFEGELLFQNSTLKGLCEVTVSSLVEAECLVARGMLKRATAATCANDQSSRSQVVINISVAPRSIKNESRQSSDAVLTIVDLAGTERVRKTGIQGTRLVESNFINNTSMIFGQCLRSLLVHQRNPKKALQKHFHNSLLTRYLRDYLEGKKRFTMILTAKPGGDDYLDTSFLLRQASPYMKIRFNNTQDVSIAPQQKRSALSSCQLDQEKRRKFCDSVHGIKRAKDGSYEEKNDSSKDFNSWQNLVQCPEIDKQSATASFIERCHHMIRGIKRNEHVMSCFSRALWNVLKDYKHKLEASEIEVQCLKEMLRSERTRTGLLEQELQTLTSLNSVRVYSPCSLVTFPEDDPLSKSCPTTIPCISTRKDPRDIDGNHKVIWTKQITNNKHDSLETKSGTVELSSAKQDHKEEIATMSNGDLLHHSVLKDTEEQPHSSPGICRQNLEAIGNISPQKYTSPGEIQSTLLAPIPQNSLKNVVKDLPVSVLPVVEDGGMVESGHVKPASLLKKVTNLKPPNANEGKRRLLPASEILLKEFSGLDISATNRKEDRIAEKKQLVEERQRSQGSISLVRLLRSNLVK